MQHQPNLLHLGRARLALFRAFCLPTIIHQTSQKFLWIIQTDPMLNSELMEAMTSLLSPYPHFFLVRSNHNNNGDGSTKLLKSINVTSIVTGDLQLLNHAIIRLQEEETTALSIIIETRLDADDGLNVHFLDYLQSQAAAAQKAKKKNRVYYYCVDKHLEWHSQQSNNNQLVPSRRSHCITPGLTTTTITTVNGAHNTTTLPRRIPHHKLHYSLPACNDDNEKAGTTTTRCLVRLVDFPGPAAIRARTPTSAGMADVRHSSRWFGSSSEQDDDSSPWWDVLQETFRIDRAMVKNASLWLELEKSNVAKENLEGQWYVQWHADPCC